MNSFMFILVLAQLTQTVASPHRHHMDTADAATVDVSQLVLPSHNREPAICAVAPSDYQTPQPQPPAEHAPTPHAPWYVYALAIAAVTIVLGELIGFGSKVLKRSESKKIAMSDKEIEPYGDEIFSVPKTAQQYAAYAASEKFVLTPILKEPRTLEQCQAIYLEGVESFVERMVWPEKVRTAIVADAPVEMRCRAWLGDSWDREPVMRATGKSKGMALKCLLRKYNENGGVWISHAIQRSKVTT